MNQDIMDDIISKGVSIPSQKISYSRLFTLEKYKKIQLFNSIEDTFSPRWGAIFHNSVLYLYRTWTQHCIFTVHFLENGSTTHIIACRDGYIYDSFSDEPRSCSALPSNRYHLALWAVLE